MSAASPALLRTLAEKADARHSALLVIDVKRFNRDYGLVVNSGDLISVSDDRAPVRKIESATSTVNLTS